MLKKLLRRRWVQAAVVALVGQYLAFVLRTTRWTLDGAENLAPHHAGKPMVVAFWHERLPLMPALWTIAQGDAAHRRDSPHRDAPMRARVLASRHSDGRLLGELMRRFGVGVVHGSTRRDGRDRGGAAGLRALLNTLEAGDHVILTPDGPRGPRRVAASGVAQLAAVSGAPILPCAAQTTRKLLLRTWDRMVLPLPWARGVLVCAPTIAVGRDSWEDAMPWIAAALTDAADRADRLCAERAA